MAEDVRVVIGGDSQALNQALAQSQQIVARARAGIQQELDKIERGFRDKMGSAGASLRGLGGSFDQVQGVLGRLSPLLAAFGVSLGVGAVVQFARAAADVAADLGEMAEQVGVTTDKLQLYRLVASQTHLKDEELQKGLARLTRTIGEASEGNDKALARFNALGVGILDAGGNIRATEAILADTAKALLAIDDPAKRAIAVVDLFGKSGQKMLPFLKEIAERQQEWTTRLRESFAFLGPDAIARLDAFSDAQKRNAVAIQAYLAQTVDLVLQLREWLNAETALDRHLKQRQAQPSPARPDYRLPQTAVQQERSFEMRRGRALAGLAARPEDDREFESRRGRALNAVREAGPINPPSEADLKRTAAVEKYIDGLRQAAALEGLSGAEKERHKAIVEAESKLLDETGAKTRELTESERRRAIAAAEALSSAKLESDVKKAELARAADLAAQQDKDRKDAFERSNSIIEANAKRERQAEKHIAGLEREAELERLVGAEREVARATIEAQNQLLDEQGFKIRDLSDSERQRIETAVRLKDRIAEGNRQSQAALAELESFSSRAFDRIGAGITQIFLEGKRGALDFQNVFSALLSEITQELIKLAIMNPLKNALFGNVAGFQALPTLGGAGGLLTGLVDRLFAPTPLQLSGPFQHGGAFEVGGVGAPDSQMIAFRASPGERVSVETPEQQRMGDPSVVLTQHISIDARGADSSVLPRLGAILEAHKRDTVTAVYALMKKGGRESQIAGLRR